MNKTFVPKLALLASGLAAAAILLSASRPVEAGLTTHIPGTICKAANNFQRPDITYGSHAAQTTSTTATRTVVCGLPMHYSIGLTLSYDFNVMDKSNVDTVKCNVFALNTSNTVIYASPQVQSLPASNPTVGFTGYARMTVASSAFTSEDATQRHYAVCTLPKRTSGVSGSSILGIRLY